MQLPIGFYVRYCGSTTYAEIYQDQLKNYGTFLQVLTSHLQLQNRPNFHLAVAKVHGNAAITQKNFPKYVELLKHSDSINCPNKWNRIEVWWESREDELSLRLPKSSEQGGSTYREEQPNDVAAMEDEGPQLTRQEVEMMQAPNLLDCIHLEGGRLRVMPKSRRYFPIISPNQGHLLIRDRPAPPTQ